jgi:threonine/homoserine/homoserine lactone efflux protein
MIVYLLQGAGLGFMGASQPGPFQAFIISQSLQLGWRRALRAALAPLLSDGPIILLVLLLLRQVPQFLQRSLFIAGGLFLLLLAWRAWYSWRDQTGESAISETIGDRTLLKAVAMNFLSPGPYIYWSLVAGPIFLTGWRESPSNGIAFIAGFYLAMVITLSIIIVTFGLSRKLGPRIAHTLLGVSILTMICIGVYQIWRGVCG